ncbi:MAG TPA: autotransporter-associated beta strand repeat-containing protein [Candidatus Acidoferrum sp.]|nr:autotransporter-associated beta strand repeat-containing protein [Candidatus Acidoferrum sp.]
MKTKHFSVGMHKSNNNLWENLLRLQRLFALAILMPFAFTAQAQTNLYWNPQGLAGPSDGSGNWDDTTVSNWLNRGSAVVWPAASTTNLAYIGGGVPGTYYITNIAAITAYRITFTNANGYTIMGSQLNGNSPGNAPGSPALAALPNTTNTIAAFFRLSNAGDISNAPNSELIFTGGMSSSGNARLMGNTVGSSTVVMNGGTYSSTSGGFLVSGVTLDITNTILNNGARIDIARVQGNTTANAVVNVFNGGQLNANASGGNNSGNHLQISRGSPAVLNVYTGSLVTSLVYSGITSPNMSPSGNIRITPDSSSQGTLNVLGGTVLAGLGASGTYGGAGSYSTALTELTFFDANPGLNANSLAVLNMTAGSITANQILYGTPSYSSNPTNGINITGGTLYLGAPNFTYPVSGAGTKFFFNLSGGTVSAIQNWSAACAAPVNLANVNGNITFQAADINGNPFNMAFSGALTGVGGFYKTGGGTLTLSGANNYGGATVISNGTLAVSTLNSPVGGNLTLEGASVSAGLPINSVVIATSGQSWTVGNLTYDTGTPTADFNYGTFGPSTTVPPIQVNGNLAFNVTPNVTVEGSAIALGTYPLIKYTGTLSGTPPTTVTLSGGTYSGYVTNITAASTIALVITSSSVVNGLQWAVGSGVWNTSTLNWLHNGSPATYSDPSPVVFNDTASGPFPITVMNAITASPASILVSATNNYMITGPGVIAGSGSLVKSGSGTLALSGTNTYSGGTTIATGGGALAINYGGNGVNNSAIGTGPLTLNTGAELDNTSGNAVTLLTPITQYWNDGWTFLGTASLNLGPAPVTLGNGKVVLTVVSNTLEVDGQISDNSLVYGIQKQGAGSLTLSNLNAFSGGMDVEAGTLNINSDGAVGTGILTLNATIDNKSGAPLTLATGPSSILLKGLTFLGTTNLDLGTAPITVQSGTLNLSNNTLFVEGALNGASTGLSINGPGTLTIGGSASSGSVTFNINSGTVNLNRQSGYIGISFSGATIQTNAALVILNPTGSEFFQSPLTLNGGLLELNGDSETIASLAFNAGILRDSSPTAAQLALIATGTTSGLLTLGGVDDFDITNGATLTINGVVADNGSTNNLLLKTGAGTLILATNTTYVANTTVSNGVLSLTYPDLSTSSTVTIAAGATLDLNFTNSASTTNIIAGLMVNGVTEPNGIYSSNNLAAITSGGSLLVTGSASTASANAYLTGIVLTPAGTLSPGFATNGFAYNATSSYGASPTVTVINADLTATNELIFNGTPIGLLPSGTPSSPLSLTLGTPDVVQVLVTAQDGVTTNLYMVDVTELPSQTTPKLTSSVSAGTLNLSWPADHLGYRLLTQTNNLSRGVSRNLNDWGTVAGSTGVTSTNFSIVKTNLDEYYRLVYP